MFWRLGSLLSVIALAATLMLLSSLVSRSTLTDAMDAIEHSLRSDTRAVPAESGSETVAGAAQLSYAVATVQDVRQQLDSDQSLTLLLESACLVVLLVAGIAGMVEGWRNLVRRPDRALALLSSATARSHEDEIGRLAQALTELSAGGGGNHAEADWQRRFSADLTRRNVLALNCLQQVAALLVEAPPSELTLVKALHVLTAGLGADTAGLRLSLATQASLRCHRLIASHQVPTALTDDDAASPAGTASVRLLKTAAGSKVRSLSVPLQHGVETIAVLVAEAPESFEFEEAHLRLTQTTAMLMALALAGLSRGQEERRGALLEERAAIARELHDSLAQSLAFLKIQVARLQAALRAAPTHDLAATETASQLRDGVSSAYRQVKELISAFRVRIGSHGLGPALEEAVEEFSQRSELSIALDYRLNDCRLTVNEEFHVLQVMREGLSNTVRHARAAHVSVSLACTPGGAVTAVVEDDGKGFTVITEQPPHYGLSVMRERAASLGGDLAISARPEGGTRVCLTFVPESCAPERTTGSFSL